MEGKERAELKNKILEFLLPIDGNPHNDHIYSKMGKPVKSLAHFDIILDEIIREGERYIYYNKSGGMFYLGSNNFTEEFLMAGGFVNMYESELEAELQAASIANQEQAIRNLTEENLSLSNQVANMKLKTYLIPLIISGVSAAVAIISLVVASKSNSNSSSQSEIRNIENKIDSLRIDFKKDNDILKDRIYEAEMLIAVYESDSLN
ncbi:hypothetical protein PXD56_13745 [Maribacter sp. SA7]|uniref:hypothetical protein n=1 Tax=Maribacter zhoushanensis TaxID=3030012 RepID=UPI0023EDF179|nr:hypothetical protein [Maribacter zhoushanensis]MDF4204031.1 hypothetical protein [Maribacter zhoushanensis]